jgi:hypothetical protein
MIAHRAVDEDRRRRSQAPQRTMHAAWRNDDEAFDIPGEGLHGPHLFVRVFAGVHQEHLQVALPGRTLNRSHQGREVWIGDVRDDHRDVARPSCDQAAGGTVRDESEFPHGFLDSAAGFRSDLLGDVHGARHGCRMHAGERRNVEDRCSLLAPHAARPYTAPCCQRRDA